MIWKIFHFVKLFHKMSGIPSFYLDFLTCVEKIFNQEVNVFLYFYSYGIKRKLGGGILLVLKPH